MRTSPPTERILSALANRNCDPKRNGKGWSARCPAHEDRRPSLSVSEGDDGRALVRCHAGCTVESICDAVGLRLSDLMTDDPSTSTELRQARENRQYRRPQNGIPRPTYQTAREAIAALEHKHGQRSAKWIYNDALGDPVCVIVRWDKACGKVIRPVSKVGDRWIIGGMPEPRPLYRLPDQAYADRVVITEGEKAADAARSIGLTATTSAHGSSSPHQTDWSPLAGKECWILPDHDEPGVQYAEAVADILAKLTPPAAVKVVHLPELPDHGDIVDWIAGHGDAEPDELRRQVEALADEAAVIQPDQTAVRHIEQFRPFPTDSLPEPIRGFVKAGAKSIGCAPSFLALPMLTVLAAAIGNTRRLQLKRGWSVPAIIWTAIVGESGTLKTPAFKLVIRPVRDRQRQALKAYEDTMKQFEADLARYDKALGAWKKNKADDKEPPTKPATPQAVRFIVSDTTVVGC